MALLREINVGDHTKNENDRPPAAFRGANFKHNNNFFEKNLNISATTCNYRTLSKLPELEKID